MSQCVNFSDVFVCFVGIPLLNDSYLSSCNSKGRDLEVFSCQHDANFTQCNSNDRMERLIGLKKKRNNRERTSGKIVCHINEKRNPTLLPLPVYLRIVLCI